MAQETFHSGPVSAKSGEIEIVVEPNAFQNWFVETESKLEKAHQQCIPRVPSILRDRNSNKKLFDPVMVSLGPYHHGKPHLKCMEKHKFEAMKRFTDHDSEKAACFYKQLETVLLEARKWYMKPIELKGDEFKIMMFMDSCFVLNFIKEYDYEKNHKTTNAIMEQPLLNSHNELLVLRDMMMLENQIPFVVLNKLMSFKRCPNASNSNFFTSFVDVVLGRPSSSTDEQCDPIHLLDLFRSKILGPPKKERNIYNNGCFNYTVTELKEAGILCRKGNMVHLNEFGYQKKLFHRVLLLPHIVIDDTFKYLYLNMVAYEMGPGGPLGYGITSYICFMDALIDREEDVKELRTHHIVENYLGSDKELADLFNGMGTDLILDSDAYGVVRSSIASHFNSRNVKFWVHMQAFYQTYFNSPWALISLFAAMFLLFLTAVQTYITVFPPSDEK